MQSSKYYLWLLSTQKSRLRHLKKTVVDIYSHKLKKASEPVGDVAKILREESTAEADNITSQYFPFAKVTEERAKATNADGELNLYF